MAALASGPRGLARLPPRRSPDNAAPKRPESCVSSARRIRGDGACPAHSAFHPGGQRAPETRRRLGAKSRASGWQRRRRHQRFPGTAGDVPAPGSQQQPPNPFPGFPTPLGGPKALLPPPWVHRHRPLLTQGSLSLHLTGAPPALGLPSIFLYISVSTVFWSACFFTSLESSAWMVWVGEESAARRGSAPWGRDCSVGSGCQRPPPRSSSVGPRWPDPALSPCAELRRLPPVAAPCLLGSFSTFTAHPEPGSGAGNSPFPPQTCGSSQRVPVPHGRRGRPSPAARSRRLAAASGAQG